MFLSVVVPCYNETQVLPELYSRLTAVCGSLRTSHELIFVNDGSTDATWAFLVSLAQRDPRVVSINLSRNHGHQLALSAGLSICQGERVLIIDADLQDPPELLREMLRLMDEGADVVYGQRESRRGESFFKRGSAYLFYRVLNLLSDRPVHEDAGDFRLINRRVLDVLNGMPENHRFLRGMISWIGYRQVPIQYVREPRFAGQTKYSLARMAHFALDAITSFSVKPLRLAFYCAIFFSMLSVGLLAWAVLAYATEKTVPGWTSLTALLLLLSAVQFLFLGLIGEYVGRLYIQSKRRPLFLVDQVIRGGQVALAATLASVHEERP